MKITWYVASFLQLANVSVAAIGLSGLPSANIRGDTDELLRPIHDIANNSSDGSEGLAIIAENGGALTHQRVVDFSVTPREPYWWLTDPRFKHKVPFASSGKDSLFRNVKDYGAVGDGRADDWAAIMAAMTAGGRCGVECRSTSTKQAIVYFPPGTYRITKPIVHYYFTTMVGHPQNRATILGDRSFVGIALVDTNVYVEGGQWYDTNSNFYRIIRNLNFDLRQMPNRIERGARDAPTGIHWQNSQACSLQALTFWMPPWQNGGTPPTHLGIFTENGSGGFVSNITFDGGDIGFWLGSQQYTVRDLRFRNCGTAVHADWAWGTTYDNIDIENCDVGIDATSHGGAGALSIIDSDFRMVKRPIVTAGGFTEDGQAHSDTSIVADNVRITSANAGLYTVIASTSDGTATYIVGKATGQDLYWTHGKTYDSTAPQGRMESDTSPYPAGNRPRGLVAADNKFFSRNQPQYDNLGPDDFLNVLDFGASNEDHWLRTGPTTAAINMALRIAAQQNKVLVFPAGIYLVNDTIFIPPGTRMVGASWSQIAAIGPKFADPQSPQVVIRVGRPGNRGRVEISDMIVTQSGPTAGAIFMEWNIHEETPGSAAMWNVIFRVGGATGTEIDKNICASDKQTGDRVSPECMAGSMMLHVTKKASIYMENMWFWVADHDLDDNSLTNTNVYNGRGVLIESQGPSWIYGTSNEHSTLYNWQLSGAKDIFMGHIQSETPYFQGGPISSLVPYKPKPDLFADDPDFRDCDRESPEDARYCRQAWALRIVNSTNVYMYGGGFYSFFLDHNDTCSKAGGPMSCQEKLVEVRDSRNVQLYSLFTVGAPNMVQADGGQQLSTQIGNPSANRYATSLAAWLWNVS